jgi:hypothetical protein
MKKQPEIYLSPDGRSLAIIHRPWRALEQQDVDTWEVTLVGGVIGTGVTRQEAVTAAVARLEWAAGVLQETPAPGLVLEDPPAPALRAPWPFQWDQSTRTAVGRFLATHPAMFVYPDEAHPGWAYFRTTLAPIGVPVAVVTRGVNEDGASESVFVAWDALTPGQRVSWRDVTWAAEGARRARA